MVTTEPAAQPQDPTKELAVRVEQETKKALAAFSLNEKTFKPVKEKWMAVTLTGPEDENLEGMAEIYRKSVKTRTAVEATRVNVKAPFLNAGKAIDNRAKALTALVTPLESHAKTQLDKVERIKAERKQAFLQARIRTMQEAGFLYDGMFYTAGSVMVDPARVADIADAEFVGLVEQGRAEAAEIKKRQEEARLELERLEKLKAELPAEVVQAQKPPQTQPQAPTRMVFENGAIKPADAPEAIQPATSTPGQMLNQAYQDGRKEGYEQGYHDGNNMAIDKVLKAFADPSVKTRGEFKAAVEALRL